MKEICFFFNTTGFVFMSEKKESDKIQSANTFKLFDILLSEETGINFENKLTESLGKNGVMYEYYYNGGGLAVADFNNDGEAEIISVPEINKYYSIKQGVGIVKNN